MPIKNYHRVPCDLPEADLLELQTYCDSHHIPRAAFIRIAVLNAIRNPQLRKRVYDAYQAG